MARCALAFCASACFVRAVLCACMLCQRASCFAATLLARDNGRFARTATACCIHIQRRVALLKQLASFSRDSSPADGGETCRVWQLWRCRSLSSCLGARPRSTFPTLSRSASPIRAALLCRVSSRLLAASFRSAHSNAPWHGLPEPQSPSLPLGTRLRSAWLAINASPAYAAVMPCFFTRHSGFALGYPLATLGPRFARRLPCTTPRLHLGRQPCFC